MYYIRQLGAQLNYTYWRAEPACRWTTSPDYATRFDTEYEAEQAASAIPDKEDWEICYSEFS